MTELKLTPLTTEEFADGSPAIYFSKTSKNTVCDYNKGNIHAEDTTKENCKYSTFDDNIDEVYKLELSDLIAASTVVDFRLWPFITNKYGFTELLNGVKL